jgi:PAS domain S-box-containing protein
MRPEDLGIGKLFERVRDAVIVADAATQQILLWNRAATEIFGYTLAEALRMRVEVLIPEHLKGRHRKGIVRYGETGHGVYIDSQALLELPAVKKGGAEILIEMSLNPVGFPGEEKGRFVLAIIRDITERKRGEEALRDAEALFHSVFDNASIGVAVVGPDGQFLRVNRALCEILGHTEQALLATTVSEITHPDDLDSSVALARRATEGEIDRYSLEKRYIGAAGRPVWVSLNVSLVRDAEGMPLYFVDQIQDITERKEDEEEIRRLNETLEERVAERTSQLAEREARLRTLLGKLVVAQEEERRRVAYEVHDGLAQMIVAVQQHLQAFAKQHSPDDPRGRESLNWNLALIQQTVEEARRVIAGLRPTALDDFGLAAALRLLAENLRSEGLEIAYNEELGDERLSATLETALYRIVQEALTNVRKHADTTSVGLSIGRLGQEVRLRVRDRGRGFSETEMVRAGGPGERVGISGMQERVALLGGTFEVLSCPGSGTLIVARVPFEGSGEDVEGG